MMYGQTNIKFVREIIRVFDYSLSFSSELYIKGMKAFRL